MPWVTTRVNTHVVETATAMLVIPPTFMYSVAPVAPRPVQRADHRERGQIDAVRTKAGAAHGLEQTVDHVASRRHQHDAGARALGGLDDAERVVLEDRLVEWHRDVVLSLEADRGVDVLGMLERR